MSTKDFKAGIEAGAKPFKDIMKNQAQATEEIRQIQNAQVEQLVEGIYDVIEQQDRRDKYGLSKVFDVRDLEELEKTFLVSALFKMSKEASPSEMQQSYFKMIKTLLGIVSVQHNVPLENIEHIGDVEAQKVILRVILEYIFIFDKTWNFSNTQKQFLSSFHVNEKVHHTLIAEIEEEVDAFGVDVLVQKYNINNDNVESTITSAIEKNIDDTVINITSDTISDSNDAVKDIEDPYRICKDIILLQLATIFPSEGEKTQQNSRRKRLDKFCEKYASETAPEARIAFAENGMPATIKVLFTTSGMHVASTLAKEAVVLRYIDIDFEQTVIERSKKSGKVKNLVLNNRLGTCKITIPEAGVDLNALQNMLMELPKVPTSLRDTPQLVTEFSEQFKECYGKLLVWLCKSCKLKTIEALRLAHDLNMGMESFKSVFDYSTMEQKDTIDSLLRPLMQQVPYPSKESAGFAIIQDLVMVIQYASQSPRNISAQQNSFIYETAHKLNINDDIVGKLIPVAQIPYRAIKNDITSKEIDALSQALATVAAGVSLPIAVIFGSSVLFWKLFWFSFIPGFGTIATTSVIAVAATKAFLKKFNHKVLSNQEMEKKKAIDTLAKSYISLGNGIRSVVECNSYAPYAVEVIAAAGCTSKELEKAINDKMSFNFV